VEKRIKLCISTYNGLDELVSLLQENRLVLENTLLKQGPSYFFDFMLVFATTGLFIWKGGNKLPERIFIGSGMLLTGITISRTYKIYGWGKVVNTFTRCQNFKNTWNSTAFTERVKLVDCLNYIKIKYT